MSHCIIKYSEPTRLAKGIGIQVDTGYVEGESMRTGFRVWAKEFKDYSEAKAAIETLKGNPFWENCTFEIEEY